MADLARYGAWALALPIIAERTQISRLPRTAFRKLRRAGLVSARGRSGGYRLSRPANAITVGHYGGGGRDTRMTRCGGEAAKRASQALSDPRAVDALGDQRRRVLESVTLQEVLDGIPPAKRAMQVAAVPIVER
jgi:DNA-binding IscR family transcriptional regulator